MNIIDEIITALLLLGPEDLEMAKRYLKWIKARRRINDRFYLAAHWVADEKRYHWVGQA